MGLKKFDKVEIKWKDAKIDTTVYDLEGDKYMKVEPEIRYTLGYFLYHDDKKILIASTKDKDTVAEINVIPKDWQISMKILKNSKNNEK